MLYFYSLILTAIVANAVATVVPDSANITEPLGTAGRCQCYIVSGPNPGYFQHYAFYDFRSIGRNDGRKDKPKLSPTTKDSVLDDQHHNAPSTSPEKVPLTRGDWYSQAWHRSGSRLFPVPIKNSPRNVFISRDDASGTAEATYLTMRTTRHKDFSSTAEIVSRMKNFLHCSVRFRLRLFSGTERAHPTSAENISEGDNVNLSTLFDVGGDSSGMQKRQPTIPPPPGAVAGLFTYHSLTSESDIEILTADPPNQVRYVNQPSYDPIADVVIPGAGTTVTTLPVPWTEWATHRLDWFPDISRWYLNNVEQATKTYGVPFDPSMLVINLWSDGGIWSGNLTVGAAVHLGIEWIEIAYNTSGPVEGPGDGKSRGEVGNGFNLEPTTNNPNHGGPGGQHATNARVCMVGCRIDDPDNGAKNIGNPQVAWDNSPNAKTKSRVFNPVILPNPLVPKPQNSEAKTGGESSAHSLPPPLFAMVFAVVGIVCVCLISSR